LNLGGRRHDSVVIGDRTIPAYKPRAILICENKDTYFRFPEYPGLITVWGNGNFAAKGEQTGLGLPDIEWIASADQTVYWGDIDADGFKILSGLRDRLGDRVQSILMDLDALHRYERYGTNQDKNNRPITAAPRLPLNLNGPEQAAYEQITSPDCIGYRRIEQERVPHHDALAALQTLLAR